MSPMMIRIEQANIEDAYVMGRNFARTLTTKISHTLEVKVEQGVRIGIAPTILPHNRKKYHGINPETGFPILGTELKVGDCIFAMYKAKKTDTNNTKNASNDNEDENDDIVNEELIENCSKFVEQGKEGIISKFKSYPFGNALVYRITVSCCRPPWKGDKIASRYSQKGVIGDIIPDEQLPSVIETNGKRTPYYGVKPNVIFSPMSLTSRATPGVIIEMMLGTYATMTGKQVDATAFSMNIDRVQLLHERACDYGI